MSTPQLESHRRRSGSVHVPAHCSNKRRGRLSAARRIPCEAANSLGFSSRRHSSFFLVVGISTSPNSLVLFRSVGVHDFESGSTSCGFDGTCIASSFDTVGGVDSEEQRRSKCPVLEYLAQANITLRLPEKSTLWLVTCSNYESDRVSRWGVWRCGRQAVLPTFE